MFQVNSVDKDVLRFTHHKFKGVYHVWKDRPKDGYWIVARVRDFDEVGITIFNPNDEPVKQVNQLLENGWRRL